jgi:lipoate-protein ligase A
MDLVAESGDKVLGGALRRRGERGLYQGSLRLAASEDLLRRAIIDGLSREFGRAPSMEIAAAWLGRATELEEKYASDRWNKRR